MQACRGVGLEGREVAVWPHGGVLVLGGQDVGVWGCCRVFGFYVCRTEERLLLVIGCKVMEGPCCRPAAGPGSAGYCYSHKADPLVCAENFRKLISLVMSFQSPLPRKPIIVLSLRELRSHKLITDTVTGKTNYFCLNKVYFLPIIFCLMKWQSSIMGSGFSKWLIGNTAGVASLCYSRVSAWLQIQVLFVKLYFKCV